MSTYDAENEVLVVVMENGSVCKWSLDKINLEFIDMATTCWYWNGCSKESHTSNTCCRTPDEDKARFDLSSSELIFASLILSRELKVQTAKRLLIIKMSTTVILNTSCDGILKVRKCQMKRVVEKRMVLNRLGTRSLPQVPVQPS